MTRRALVVCIGNICRSPYAAALLQKRLGDGVVVESAGIFAASGLPAADEMVELARQNGLDLSGHRARHVRELDLDSYDHVVALTSQIAAVLIDDHGVDSDRVTALDIADPYGETMELYRHCVEEIHEAVTDLAGEW